MTKEKETKSSKVSVIASRSCKIARKEFSYIFKAGVKTEVDPKHLKTLKETGLIKEAK